MTKKARTRLLTQAHGWGTHCMTKDVDMTRAVGQAADVRQRRMSQHRLHGMEVGMREVLNHEPRGPHDMAITVR